MHYPLRRFPVIFALFLLALTGRAEAEACGDDVAGSDVPCRCGDTLAGSVLLGEQDPITRERCSGDGLIVFAADPEAPIVLDLGGRVLRGSAAGAAVRIVFGGGGVTVTSSHGMAQIEGFRDGVDARPENALTRIENVSVEGCTRDGLRLTGAGTAIEMVDVRGVGRDGLSLRGSAWRLRDVRAIDNGRHGFQVFGQNGHFGVSDAGPIAAGNAADGFLLMGRGHEVVDCWAAANGGDGLHINGIGLQIEGCTSTGNRGRSFGGNLHDSDFVQVRTTPDGAPMSWDGEAR